MERRRVDARVDAGADAGVDAIVDTGVDTGRGGADGMASTNIIYTIIFISVALLQHYASSNFYTIMIIIKIIMKMIILEMME